MSIEIEVKNKINMSYTLYPEYTNIYDVCTIFDIVSLDSSKNLVFKQCDIIITKPNNCVMLKKYSISKK